MKVAHKINDDALSRLASDVIRLFPAGDEFTAEAIFAAFPQIAESRRAAFKVSFEEYLRRVDNDEPVDLDEFVSRFPEIEGSLRREIDKHLEVLRDPALLEELLATAWPVPDSQFLDWKIRRLIGCGGFSRVYLADEPKVGNRPVALKLTIRSGRECDLVGRLSHPGICQILSVRDDDPTGITAIAMPFHGEATLHDLIDKTWSHEWTRAARDLPDWGAGTAPDFVNHVLKLAVRLCEALEYAHEQQVLHCDLKPSNILLKSDGSPLLLDFNLAFSMQDESRVVGGTVGYMAPEQVRAILHKSDPTEVDARADVFGLGAVLYHVLSGSAAHVIEMRSNLDDRLQALLDAEIARPPVPLQQRNAAVRPEVSDLIQRCLDPDPNRRPPSVKDVRQALERMLPAVARPVSRRTLLAISLAATTAVAALVAVIALHRPDPALAASNVIQPGASINITQEIARLEAIPADEITPAERELLGYYYCLDEKWGSASETLQALVDDNLQSAAIFHNLAYATGRLSDYSDACQLYEDALDIDGSQGKSWAALVYNETFDAMNKQRPPNHRNLEQAIRYCDDSEMIDLLSQLVACGDRFVTVAQENSDSERPEIADEIQPIMIGLSEIESTRWLIAPASLPSAPIENQLASN